MHNLKGKKILVTGASSGIGANLALLLAEKGAELILVGTNETKLHDISRQASNLGITATPHRTDLRNSDEIRQLVAFVEAQWGYLDALVNNAGVFLFERFDTITEYDIDQLLSVNLKAPILLTRLLLPLMKASTQAHIVNVASTAATLELPLMATYAATKAGIETWSMCLSEELHPEGIRVSVILPGMTRTRLISPLLNEFSRFKVPIDPPDLVANEIVSLLFANKKRRIVNWKQRVLVGLKRHFGLVFKPIKHNLSNQMLRVTKSHSTIANKIMETNTPSPETVSSLTAVA